MPRTIGLTARQRLALREYSYGHVRQADLAREWGVTQSAVSQRLSRARRAAGTPQRRKAFRRIKVRLSSLSDAVNV